MIAIMLPTREAAFDTAVRPRILKADQAAKFPLFAVIVTHSAPGCSHARPLQSVWQCI
ncbi:MULTISPECIES: hypothetical protein [Bradyrhizobium]|uniref:hypothetical protein n=1 Tax=Bradyrhizobium elkanii TaxID=29448 RepID=UPI0018AD44B4|nr:hypothetical protein [Bradyrhizobium elkanii]